MADHIHIRAGSAPDDAIVMLRAGDRGLAGRLRGAGFELMATGRDPRHYTVVLERLSMEVLERLGAQFVKATRP